MLVSCASCFVDNETMLTEPHYSSNQGYPYVCPVLMRSRHDDSIREYLQSLKFREQVVKADELAEQRGHRRDMMSGE